MLHRNVFKCFMYFLTLFHFWAIRSHNLKCWNKYLGLRPNYLGLPIIQKLEDWIQWWLHEFSFGGLEPNGSGGDGSSSVGVQRQSFGRVSRDESPRSWNFFNICRHCLQILTAKTIKSWQFYTIRLLVIDHWAMFHVGRGLSSGGLTMRQWRHEPPAPNFWTKKSAPHSESVQIFEVLNLYNPTV